MGPSVSFLNTVARKFIPTRLWDAVRVAFGRAAAVNPHLAATSHLANNVYEALYEAHGRKHADEEAVGGGDFVRIGRIELGVLLAEGLRPSDSIVDFGCGTGRLAVQLVPRLRGGHYIGIDIAKTMLTRAEQRLRATLEEPACRVSWIKQIRPPFPLATQSVDMMCAFSVFTHMEHEDTYCYLRDAARVVRPGGRFVLSCLPMDNELARRVFLQSAADDFRERWGKVRNVTTSVDFLTAIAKMAGWTPLRWYPGGKPNIPLPDSEGHGHIGQSVCVLTHADSR